MVRVLRAFLTHVSDWHCENFVISKQLVQRDQSKANCYCICLFGFFSVKNVYVGLLHHVQMS